MAIFKECIISGLSIKSKLIKYVTDSCHKNRYVQKNIQYENAGKYGDILPTSSW